MFGSKTKKEKKINGNAFNFGPNNKSSITVLDLIKKMKKSGKQLIGKSHILRKANTSSNCSNLIALKFINLLNGNVF